MRLYRFGTPPSRAASMNRASNPTTRSWRTGTLRTDARLEGPDRGRAPETSPVQVLLDGPLQHVARHAGVESHVDADRELHLAEACRHVRSVREQPRAFGAGDIRFDRRDDEIGVRLLVR